MALVNYTNNPTITDTVLFQITTPGADGLFTADPYKVDYVKIYYVERDTANGSNEEYEINRTDGELSDQLKAAKAAACLNTPTDVQLDQISQLEEKISLNSTTETLYFSESKTVVSIGDGSTTPAWLSTDQPNASIKHITEDEDGNPVYGQFSLEWNPLGMREGDYFVSWTWTPNPDGDKLSKTYHFTLFGDTQITTSIPSHFTNPIKYETLQERYLPEMFKMTMLTGDLSPSVIKGVNGAVAKGFTFLEDMANQMVDLPDANSTHESLLTLLGNTFGLKLRSNDPTMWRRQIKRAIPLFKKKGTLSGLTEALGQAGVKLAKFTKLWQVISKYTYQESFEVIDGLSFNLSRRAVVPLDSENTEVYIRQKDQDNWVPADVSSVEISDDGEVSTVEWVDGNTAPDIGDSIRLVYKILNVPNSTEQSKENYIRTLALADQRDERSQKYPLKNWNVRVISEDDALFDDVVETKHPFHDPVVWGWVRTEFAYSENIYNMEEYNGSKRQSIVPCDIDKDFVDPCSQGLSSKYTVDLEIENLSSDRILEATDIIKDYTPFHSVLHSMNLFGGLNDFIQPPVEEINALIRYNEEEITLANSQGVFNRSMEESNVAEDAFVFKNNYTFNLTYTPVLPIDENYALYFKKVDATKWSKVSLSNIQINTIDPSILWIGEGLNLGDMLKFDYKTEFPLLVRDYDAGLTQSKNALTKRTVVSGYNNVAGHVSNDEIVLFSPDQELNHLGLNTNPDLTFLEVLAPSSSQGTYKLSNPLSHIATVNKTDPKDDTGFTYRLSNQVIRMDSSASVVQDDYFVFKSDAVDWSKLGLKTTWDVNNDGYTQPAWKITLGSGTYNILNALPDGSVILNDNGTLPKTNQSNVSFSVKNSANTEIVARTDGNITIKRRGRLDLAGSTILVNGTSVATNSIADIRNILSLKNYYLLLNGTQYPIDFVDGEIDQLYLINYAGGNANGVTATVYQRLVDSALGFFHYNGATLNTGAKNLETELGIVSIDGNTTQDVVATSLKENYLLLLPTDSGTDYYSISEIDGNTIKISGPKYDWGLSGQDINFSVVNYEKLPVQINKRINPPIEGMNFDLLDRSGNTAVFAVDTSNQDLPPSLASVMLNKSKKKDQMIESVSQSESITFEIETKEE